MVSRKNVLFTVSLFSLLELGGCSQLNQSGNCTMSGQYADQQSCQTKNPSANCSLSTAVSPDGQTLACWKVIPKVTTNQQSSSPTACTSTWEEGAWGNCDGKLKHRSVTCKAGCTCNEKTKPSTSANCGDVLAGGIHTKQECLANQNAKVEFFNGGFYCGVKGDGCPASWNPLTKNRIPYTITKGFEGAWGCGQYINNADWELAIENNKIVTGMLGVTGHIYYQPIKPESIKFCKSCTPIKDKKNQIVSAKCNETKTITLPILEVLCY